MALITTGANPKALVPGVKAWVGMGYGEHPEEWRDLFEVDTSTRNFEEDVLSTGFGMAPVKQQGKSVTYYGASQGWVSRYVHVVYGIGFILTREEQEDNLYKDLARKRAMALGFSMRQTKETVHANIINRAETAAYTGGDGQTLSSTTHPLKGGGTYQNRATNHSDLNETAIEDMLILIMTAVDDEGNKISIMGESLHVHPNDFFNAHRTLDSMLQSGGANNDTNVLRAQGMLPKGIKVNHYFTDTDAWCIKTNCPRGLISYERRAREETDDSDFDTENMKFKSTERYVPGWTDPKGIYFSAGG